MTFNRQRRGQRPGPRFGEMMGKLCHQAITFANRNKRDQFDACVKELYQMLDTIETETWGVKHEAVATESEPSAPFEKPKEEAPRAKAGAKKSRPKSKAKQQPGDVPDACDPDSGE